MAIMTLLVSYNYAVSLFYVCFSAIEEYIAKMSKTSKSNSAMSVSLDNGRFKKFSVFSRCNSFSSCSNDSAVYCGHHTIQTRFRNAKRAVVNNSSGPRKRSRNSSGSSISSNMSCVSDKDLKSAKVLSPTVNKTEIKNCVSNKSSRLKYSKINSSSGELKEETIVNKELNCSENSLVILPNRHNLRGKITKKGCTCCPSTCTTVFLRHYKKFVQTSDENTVISSTKVKTFVQKSSAPSTPEINKESNMLSNKSKSRKRRSEIEKLYESLHEIEWAKNFSPDNILTQINVRQAASCSAFGKTQNTTKCSRPTVCRKQKNLSHFCNDINSPFNKSECTKPNFSVTDCSKSNCKESAKSILSRETGTPQNCDNEQKVADLQTTAITTSDIYHCKKNYKSCSSQSSVNITCSMSHINLKEININSVESVHHTRSLVTENCADSSDDAQLSYASDESSSAVSASIVNIQSKHLLDLDYKDKKQPRSLSETDVSEFSPTPTFFDIAEEGIRTIDACFREVGAEVVVSTCYDEESSLPLLTSITENKISSKVLSNADPPILEPCIDVALKQNLNCSNKNNCGKVRESNRLKQNVSLKTKLKNIYDKNHLSLQSEQGNSQIKVESQTLKMKHALSRNIDLITVNAAKRILKKYIKRSRTRLKSLPNNMCRFTAKNLEPHNRYERNARCIKSCTVLNKTTINLPNHQSPVLLSSSSKPLVLSSSSKPLELSFKSPDKKTKIIFKAALEEKFSENRDKLAVESVKNASCLFPSGKILKCSSDITKASVISQRKSSGSKPTVITSFISTKVENENGIKKEHISRPLPSLEISYNYNSIKVNRKLNYIQIILQFTRGKSVFLTLEALTELRDVLNRANNDSHCQVLIVNAEGDSFCLGLDLKPLIGPRKKIASTEIAVAVKELIEALSEFKKPLAAVVKGPALGLGMTLLNHADFTIASEKATFCMPYSYLGYMPEGGATLTLPQIVGSTVAMDLLLRGKTLTAREAYNAGLISEVLEAKRLPYEFVSRVKMLAENPLSALETTKALLKMQLHVNLQLVLENEVKLLPRMWLTRTCQDSLRKALESGILS